MAHLSPLRKQVPVYEGLTLMNRGKVRDTYALEDGNCLMVASDGISIFDFVLNVMIPQKGQILTAMSHFWLRVLEEHGIATHLVAVGADIDGYLPSSLRGNVDLQARAMVVKKLFMRPIEFIARGYLTGSALGVYNRDHSVWGHYFLQGVQDGDALPRVLDTPTTKAQEGHDEALNPSEVRRTYPEETYTLIAAYQIISSYARSRGIIFADTKFEFGFDDQGKKICVGDEVGTGDSSRWWDMQAWEQSRIPKENRKAPAPFDKQLVRAWGIEQGINKLNPIHATHATCVHGLKLPEKLISATTATYRYIFWRLTGITVEHYFEKLGVSLGIPKKKTAIIVGSESDLPAVHEAIRTFLEIPWKQVASPIALHVASCHRNPFEVQDFIMKKCQEIDVIIAAGGKAFALPGVLDAWLHASGQEIPVIGVALGNYGTKSLNAAILSIKELPGSPVVMDEIHGEVYAGAKGIVQALMRINGGELPPPKLHETRSAQFDKDIFCQLSKG